MVNFRDDSMAKTCEKCGHAAKLLEGRTGLHACISCGTIYYRNHCWNCAKVVDSRDVVNNPVCGVCNWVKCTCQACHLGGCKTNPFKKKASSGEIRAMDEAMRQILQEEAEEEARNEEVMRQILQEEAEAEARNEEAMRQILQAEAEEEARNEEVMKQILQAEAEEEARDEEVMRLILQAETEEEF